MMNSIAIVRERETGTMEVLLASLLPPSYIVLAKAVPYFCISCFDLATTLFVARFLLHIPIAGSHFTLKDYSATYKNAMKSINSGNTDIVLNIPQGFEKDLVTQGTVPDVLLPHGVHSHERTVHTRCLNAMMGTDPHLHQSTSLVHRGHAHGISERLRHRQLHDPPHCTHRLCSGNVGCSYINLQEEQLSVVLRAVLQ